MPKKTETIKPAAEAGATLGIAGGATIRNEVVDKRTWLTVDGQKVLPKQLVPPIPPIVRKMIGLIPNNEKRFQWRTEVDRKDLPDLHQAFQWRKSSLVKKLLRQGASPSQIDKELTRIQKEHDVAMSKLDKK